MDRRTFTKGLAGLGLAAASPASAFELRNRQVLIEARILIVRERSDLGFGVDLTRDWPRFDARGGTGGNLTFGVGIGSERHNEHNDRLGTGLRLNLGRSLGKGPDIGALTRGARPSGKIGLKGDAIIHAAKSDTYDGIDRLIIVAGGETAVIGGLQTVRKKGRTRKLPVLGGIPVIGEAFLLDRNRDPFGEDRRSIIITIKPRLIREN